MPCTGSYPPSRINGTALNFDVPPVVVNDRIMVPIRTVFEAMGAKVSWEQTNMTATAVVKISSSPAADEPVKKGLTVGEDKGF